MTNTQIVRWSCLLIGAACLLIATAWAFTGGFVMAATGYIAGGFYLLAGVSIDEPRPRY